MKYFLIIMCSVTIIVSNYNANSQTKIIKKTKQHLNTNSCSMNVSRLQKIDILSNLHVPKYVIIGLNPGNENIIIELYNIIEKINVKEKLKRNYGYYQEIKLLVVVPDYYNNKTSEIKYVNNIPNNDYHDLLYKIANNSYSSIPSLNYIEKVNLYYENFIWMQDFAEFCTFWFRGCSQPHIGILDLHYEGCHSAHKLVQSLTNYLNIPKAQINPNLINNLGEGDKGGNIESTHEGLIYTGNNINSKVYQNLRLLTGQKIIKVPTDWLDVGHVDEYLAFIPAKNKCGSALLLANPLDALNLIYASGKWKGKKAGELSNSFRYFLKKPWLKKKYYKINDFDLNKPKRKKRSYYNSYITLYSDWLIYYNLKAYYQIRKGATILKNNSKCLDDIISVPVLFSEASDEHYLTTTLLSAQNPLTNLLVLRDHLIVPKGEFSSVLKYRLKSLVDKNKIHFIDAKWYEKSLGSIHCATITIRDPQYIIGKQKRLVKTKCKKKGSSLLRTG